MEIIYRLFGIKAEPRMTRFLALQLSADHYFDNHRAQTLLGYRPFISTEEAMADLESSLRNSTH